MKTQLNLKNLIKGFFGLTLIALSVLSCKKNEVAIKATLSTVSASNITSVGAIAGGDITSDGGGSISERGLAYGTTSSPTITDNKLTAGTGKGIFSASISNLTPGTKYFVRAYATNSAGIAYGDEINFTTLATSASLTTIAASNIASTSATVGGNITGDGGASITERGIVYNINHSPTINDNKVTAGTGNGIFSADLTGLLPNTVYYARAYATNNATTAYGNEVTFTTLTTIPSITTDQVSYQTEITAIIAGTIVSDGGSTVTDAGIAYSTSHSPTNVGQHGALSLSGSSSTTAMNLLPGTTYYARAYAVNSVGIAYGNEISFTTNPVAVPSGLLAYYKFSWGNYGDFYPSRDYSGNGNNLTLSNMTFGGDFYNNNYSAAIFNGTNGQATCTSIKTAYPTLSAFSIAFWAKVNTASDGAVLEAPGFGIAGVAYNNKMTFIQCYGGPCNYYTLPDNTFVPGEWHHIVYTYDGTSLNVYYDTMLKSTTSYPGSSIVPDLTFGTGSAGFWNGSLDNVRFYNRALTNTEVTALHGFYEQ